MKIKISKSVLLYTLGALFTLYTIVGFIFIPIIVKSIITSKGSEALGSPIRLEGVTFNPYTLNLKLDGLDIPDDSEQGSLLKWKRLTLNLSWRSLFKLSPVIDELSLDAPLIAIDRDSEGIFNFQPILDHPTKEATPAELETTPDAAEEKALPLLYIDLLAIRKASFFYVDQGFETPFRTHINPLDFELKNLSTEPNKDASAALSMTLQDEGQLEWQGNLTLSPSIQSKGSLSLRTLPVHHFQAFWSDYLNGDISRFLASFQIKYAFDSGSKENFATWTDGSLTLEDLQVKDLNNQSLASIASFSINGIEGNYNQRTVSIQEIALNKAFLNVLRLDNEELNLQQLLNLPQEEAAEETTPEIATSANHTLEASQPWKWSIGSIGLNDFSLSFLDESLAEPFNLDAILQIENKGISSDFSQPIECHALLSLAQGGTIETSAQLTLDSLDTTAQFQIDKLALESFAPYVDHFTGLNLVSGSLSSNNHIRATNHFNHIEIQNDSTLEALKILHPEMEHDLISLSSLALTDANISLPETALHIKSIDLDHLFLGFEIGPDGTPLLPTSPEDNPATALTNNHSDSSRPEVPQKPKAPATETETSNSAPLDLFIETFTLKNSQLDFLDQSVSPAAHLNISNFQILAQNINSSPEEILDLSLSAKLNQSTPLSLDAKLTPFGNFPVVSFNLNLDSLQLIPFQGYTAKYLGRYLDTGTFSVKSDVKTEGTALDAKNQFTIGKIKLGEHAETKSLIPLPVATAIMVLKNGDGDIIRDIPVTGFTDDPDFQVRRIIWTEIMNLFTKVLTSPFALLGNTLGAITDPKVDISKIYFAPGSSNLSEKEKSKLKDMAKIFAERPDLVVQLSDSDSSEIDTKALKELGYQSLLKSYQGPDTHDTNELIRLAYQDLFPKEAINPEFTKEKTPTTSSPEKVTSKTSTAKEEESSLLPQSLFGLKVQWRNSKEEKVPAQKTAPTPKAISPDKDPQIVHTAALEKMTQQLRELVSITPKDIEALKLKRVEQIIQTMQINEPGISSDRLSLLKTPGAPTDQPNIQFLLQVN